MKVYLKGIRRDNQKSSYIPELAEIPHTSRRIIFEGFSWQEKEKLFKYVYISIMIHKEL